MRRLWLCPLAALVLTLAAAPAAQAAFGFKEVDAATSQKDGTPATQAGTHPYLLQTSLSMNTEPNAELGFDIPQGAIRELNIETPPGLVGNPTATPRCSAADFLGEGNAPQCPNASAVGIAHTVVTGPTGEFTAAVYNLVPPPGAVAEIGLWTLTVPVTIELKVNPDPPHNVIAIASNIFEVAPFYSSEVTLWGVPAAEEHDEERGKCLGTGKSCPVGISPEPFLTLPSSCTGPLPTSFNAASWEGAEDHQTVFSHDNLLPPEPIGQTGCADLTFAPHPAAALTSSSASSASGLDFDLDFEDQGLSSPTGTAQATIEKAKITMPVGVSLNPGVAEGLASCSIAAYEAESLDAQGCPPASKLGEVEVETPLLEGTVLHGSVYVAAQDENLLHSRYALYMAIKDPELGILVKLPGKVAADESTGQLTTTFGEPGFEVPQFPFSHFRFHFREGPRAPLITPPRCGEYEIEAELTPSSGQAPLHTTTPFAVTSGPGGGPCQSAPAPLHPTFEAGTQSNAASTYSPFYIHLARSDTEEELSRFSSVLPKGVVGKLAGIPSCPQAAIEAAKSKTGTQELASPSCPASSKIGRVLGGAGVGSGLTYVPGSLYLGGPYHGDPLSVVAVVPAVVGSFDVGTVVVQEALTLNRASAEVEVDGGASDPIPHILAGIPLRLRDLRVYVDRSQFTTNATSCRKGATRASFWGTGTDPFSLADDPLTEGASRYQAASCGALGFAPSVKISLSGGTKRSQHPALHSKVTYPYPSGPGYANVAKAVVVLPHSEFIDPTHVGNPCTRPQFAEEKCPPISILGTARAVSPLLDQPLEGPVIFRSNPNRKLPDIVADLKGQFEIELVGFVSSQGKGSNARIRTTFASVPDAPVSSFTLDLKGGKEGLLENSANLCSKRRRLQIDLSGQNGATHNSTPVLATPCKRYGRHSRRR